MRNLTNPQCYQVSDTTLAELYAVLATEVVVDEEEDEGMTVYL